MEEKRLIYADKLKTAIRSESWVQERKVQIALDFIDIIISEQPTVDAVEVVRCDVCKNAESYDCTIHGTVHHLYKCKKDEGAIGYKKVVSSYDFCSCGKRKDGDGNG